MTFYSGVFYLLSIVTVIATVMAITRRHPVQAVVYLIISFFGTALIFYLLGAPFLAVLEVIIYAGAIMVLFLFIIMMLQLKPSAHSWRTELKLWLPATVLGGISVCLAGVMVFADPGTQAPLNAAMVQPMKFGLFLFQNYWFPVEITSFLLLIALVGALYLGRPEDGKDQSKETS